MASAAASCTCRRAMLWSSTNAAVRSFHRYAAPAPGRTSPAASAAATALTAAPLAQLDAGASRHKAPVTSGCPCSAAIFAVAATRPST
ncbi:MAG: hypothetical protein ABMA64_07750, partial [Myxococcota bacterium]